MRCPRLLLAILLSLTAAVHGQDVRSVEPLILPEVAFAPVEAGPPLRLAESSWVAPLADLPEAGQAPRREILDWNAAGRMPGRNGFVRPLPEAVRVRLGGAPESREKGTFAVSGEGRRVWVGQVRVEGAW